MATTINNHNFPMKYSPSCLSKSVTLFFVRYELNIYIKYGLILVSERDVNNLHSTHKAH